MCVVLKYCTQKWTDLKKNQKKNTQNIYRIKCRLYLQESVLVNAVYMYEMCFTASHIWWPSPYRYIYLLGKTFSKVLEHSSHVKHVNHWLISDLKQKMSFGVSWAMATKNIVPIIIISIQLIVECFSFLRLIFFVLHHNSKNRF